MGIIGTIFVGLIVGLIARALHPGKDSMGFIATIVLGILGAVVAKYAGQAMGIYAEGEMAGWIASVIAAIVLLFIYGLIAGRRQ